MVLMNFFDPCKSVLPVLIRGKGWVLVQSFAMKKRKPNIHRGGGDAGKNF